MNRDPFDLVVKPKPRFGLDPFKLHDDSRISLTKGDFSTLLLDRLPRIDRDTKSKSAKWLLITGSGRFPGLDKGALNDLRNTPTLATVLQKWYFNFGIEFSLDDITDRDALEDFDAVAKTNLILMGGVYVNVFTAYLTHFWSKLLRPGFESATAGVLHGMAKEHLFRSPTHNKYGLFNVVVNPWSAKPAICVILAGISGIGTQASTRYFIDILRNRVEPENNSEASDYPGHILKARTMEYVRTQSVEQAPGRSQVVSLDSIRGWAMIE